MNITTSENFYMLGMSKTCHQSKISNFVPGIIASVQEQADAENLITSNAFNMTLKFDRETHEVAFFAGLITTSREREQMK